MQDVSRRRHKRGPLATGRLEVSLVNLTWSIPNTREGRVMVCWVLTDSIARKAKDLKINERLSAFYSQAASCIKVNISPLVFPTELSLTTINTNTLISHTTLPSTPQAP